MARFVTLHLEHPTFPVRCANCGRAEGKKWILSAWKGISFVLLIVGKSFAIPVPICGPCSRKRKLWGFWGTLFSFILFISLLVFISIFDKEIREQFGSNGLLIFVLIYFFAGIYFLNHFIPKFLDYRFIGISVYRINSKERRITLKFKNTQFADDVEHAVMAMAQETEKFVERSLIPESYSLFFRPVLRKVFLSVTLISAVLWIITLNKLHSFSQFYAPNELYILGLVLFPIGIGFFLWSFQEIEVTSQFIISRHLGIRQSLSSVSARISAIKTNGMTITDDSKKKLFIHSFLINYNRLQNDLKGRSSI